MCTIHTMNIDRQVPPFETGSLRDPSELMRPERLGALKQTRLSFGRLLVNKMVTEGWEIRVDRLSLDEEGVGRVVYAIETPSRRFSFGVFSRNSPEGENTDRIIAEDWDLWAFLCEGEAPPEMMDAQREELPHVMEGRATPDVLIWTRANRSSRFFGHVVDSLAAGHQPDIDHLAAGGYLTRSSGYYGNGLNGTKMFRALDDDHPLSRPYMSQMLAAYMLRVFGYDLAEHVAAARNPDAPALDDGIKRYLGTGNSSGVGIVLYLVNHPKQLHAWLRAREVALARAKTVDPSEADLERFRSLRRRARRWFAEDDSETNRFFASKDAIAADLDRVGDRVDALAADPPEGHFWEVVCEWASEELRRETQEVLHSLLLDVRPEVCDGLEESLTVSERSDVVPGMEVATLRSRIEEGYAWALDVDFDRPEATRHFWYRSIENEEPRLGVRGEGPDEYELPADVARRVQSLQRDLDGFAPADTVAEVLVEHPEHRYVVERIQNLHGLPYAEIRGNPLDADFVPLHFIACLKAMWGIQKAHPKSKGWVRGTFFQGAPLAHELPDCEQEYWMFPPKPETAAHWRDDR
ncbi:hypothetical protein C468_08179 [Halorubrum kocurii JCM 14978]|uniref:Uncharacterized protein n=2 Tax=Halorubrum kocurii TaxID=478441 RepID=M0P436_9EURY|nr:hypothetical protein C468_08179 [Halorubrum kocurii JCM 14978]